MYVVMEKGETDLASLLKDYARKEVCVRMTSRSLITITLPGDDAGYDKVLLERDVARSERHPQERNYPQGWDFSTFVTTNFSQDLKPANFLLVAGRLKLIDFGIASSVQSDKTSVMIDNQMGTFNFMSPESIQDLNPHSNSGVNKPCIKISVKSDVWSLGCILYNLTYGKMPFGDIKHALMKLQAITDNNHQIPFPSLGPKVTPTSTSNSTPPTSGRPHPGLHDQVLPDPRPRPQTFHPSSPGPPGRSQHITL